MKIVKVILIGLVIFLACTFSLAANGETESDDGIIKIEYVDLGSTLKSSGALEPLLASFKADYPNVEVEVLEWPYSEARNKYNAMIQAGDPPTCGYGFLSQTGIFKAMDALVPVSEYFDDAFLDNFYGANLDPVTLADGKIWAMPLYFSLRMLVYNKKIIEDAGFTSADLETTDGFMKVAEGIYNPPNQYALAIAGSRTKNTVENFLEFFWPMGGTLLNYDSKGNPVSVAFNNELGIKALEYYGKLGKMAQVGVLNHKQTDAWTSFWSEQAFATIDQPKVVGHIMENNIDIDWVIALPPKGSNPEGSTAVLGVEDVGFLFKTNPAEQEAGANFLKAVASDEIAFLVNKSKNFIPTTKTVSANPYFKAGGEGEWLGQYIEGAPYAMFRPTLAQWGQIQDALTLAIQQVIDGKVDARTAMNEAAKSVNSLF
jgi:multiple sugar transport system substrate-binding protein